MIDRRARMIELGFGEHDIRYLECRGNKLSRNQALNSHPSGLRRNQAKMVTWFDRFTARTKWTEDELHIRLGKWIVEGVCPVEFEPKDPVTCPSCKEELSVTKFLFYPLELRCDDCLMKEMRVWVAEEKAKQAERTSLGAKLAEIVTRGEEEGGSQLPKAIEAMSLVVENRGGLVAMTEKVAEVLRVSSTKDTLTFFKMYVEMLKENEKPVGTGLDLESIKDKPHLKKLIVEALLDDWYREKHRPALRDLIQRYGGTPPSEDSEEEPS